MKNTALIFGISGQDGSLLANHLLSCGWDVHGASRDAELNDFKRLTQLGIRDLVKVHSAHAVDFRSVIDLLDRVEPAHVYYLSGQSSVGLSFQEPIETNESISRACLNILEAIRWLKLPIRFYNAASGDCFGETDVDGADEETPFRPRSPYAVAKASAFWAVANYREAYGLHAISGILFNHESSLRPERFVTQKIIRAAARIALGFSHAPLRLGNLDVCRDWGWAAEYVEAMHLMLCHDKPEDMVIATGEYNSLKMLTTEAFAAFGLDWEQHVEIDPEFMRPTDIKMSVGRPDRARERLGWSAKIKMREMVKRLCDAAVREFSPAR